MGEQGDAQPRLAGSRLGFETNVPTNGYRWWYLDAFSDDGSAALTVIVFIGSVFSPYYYRARQKGRGDPENFCCVNAILYGPDRRRWAMTERGREDLERAGNFIAIGNSRVLDHGAGKFVFQIDEICNPLPTRLVGQIELQAGTLGQECFALDPDGQHRWWPASPGGRVRVHFARPDLSWEGTAYLDSNAGVVALEDSFQDWHWQRSELGDHGGHIHYDARLLDGTSQSLSLQFSGNNQSLPIATEAELTTINSTPIWRAGRSCRSVSAEPVVQQTLEESPFYARSILNLDTGLGVQRVMHESLHLGRFRAPWMQWMLPVRMPRRVLNRA